MTISQQVSASKYNFYTPSCPYYNLIWPSQMLCRFSCISFLNQCNQMESRPEFFMRFNHCQIIRSLHQRFEFNSVSCCHSFNELTQLPWELRKWRMLTHLKLNRNDISFLHKSFSTMFNQLEVLEVI